MTSCRICLRRHWCGKGRCCFKVRLPLLPCALVVHMCTTIGSHIARPQCRSPGTCASESHPNGIELSELPPAATPPAATPPGGVLQYLGVAAGVTPLQAGPPASVPLYWLCLSDMRLGVAGCLQGSLLLYPGRSCVGLTGTQHPMAPDIDGGSGHPRLRRALVRLDVRCIAMSDRIWFRYG